MQSIICYWLMLLCITKIFCCVVLNISIGKRPDQEITTISSKCTLTSTKFKHQIKLRCFLTINFIDFHILTTPVWEFPRVIVSPRSWISPQFHCHGQWSVPCVSVYSMYGKTPQELHASLKRHFIRYNIALIADWDMRLAPVYKYLCVQKHGYAFEELLSKNSCWYPIE